MTATRAIDYWDIVTRSLRVTWNHKFLWFFGFFAASGGGGGGNSMNWNEHRVDSIGEFLLSRIEILVALVLFVLVLWLVFFVMNIISKGALASSIYRADRGAPVRFEDGWHAGFKAFWGLLGIAVTGIIAFLVVTTVCVLAVVLPLVAGSAGVAFAVLIGIVLIVPYLAFAFLLTFTITYAEREYVIAGAGVGDSLVAGWDLTRTCFWQSLLMWLISFGSTIAFMMGIGITILAVALPFILIGLASPPVGLILGIPIAIVILVVAVSAFSTYEHALWTLIYKDLKGEAPMGGALDGQA